MNGNHDGRGGAVPATPAADVDAGALAARADRAAAAGDLAGAVSLYQRAIGCSPATAPPMTLRLALMLIAHDRIPAALATLAALTAIVPQSAKAWQALGAAQRLAGDLAAASRSFERALALAPGDPLARLSRAQVAADLGRPAAALYDDALAADPRNAAARLAAAAAHASAGDPARAERLLRQRLGAEPGWVEGWMTLASITHQARGREAFLAILDEACRLRPRDGALLSAALRAFAAAGDHAAVLSRIGAIRAATGDSPPLRLAEAAALSETGRTADAEPLFASLADLGEPMVDLARLRHALRTGRPEQAVAIGTAFRPGAARFAIPYLGTAWRLLDDPRWHWLEGDGRLVACYPLDLAASDIEALADRLRALHQARFAPYEQSMRGGTQTEGMLLGREDPEIVLLRARLEEAVRRHVDQLPPPDSTHPLLREPRDGFRLAGSWSVRLTAGGTHVNHVHSEGWLSSACYVALPRAARDPCELDETGWLTLGEPPRELDLSLGPIRSVQPVVGQLVLFPSTMWHGTTDFARGERLTVAFDVQPLRGDGVKSRQWGEFRLKAK